MLKIKLVHGFTLSETHYFTNKFSFSTQLQYVNHELTKEFNRSQFFAGINYFPLKNIKLTIGYQNFKFKPYKENTSNIDSENRLYQQLIYTINLGKLNLANQFRFDERWIKNTRGIHFQNRMRYRALFTYPITEKWYVNLQDEIYLNLEKDKYQFNRIGIGGGYYFNKNIKMQLIYICDYFKTWTRQNLQLSLLFNTHSRKNKNKDL